MTTRIEKQKAVADSILSKLELVDPSCIVAGGAPRDWYMGKEATDIDVFLYIRKDLRASTIRKQIQKALGIDSIGRGQTGDLIPEHYCLNPKLKCVYTFEVEGEIVQLMLMVEPTYDSVVPMFPFNVCKVWYKGGTIRHEPIFEYGMKNKILVKTNNLYGPKHLYMKKIRDKFPKFKYFSDVEAFNKYLVNKELRTAREGML